MARSYNYNDAWNVARQYAPTAVENTSWDYATSEAVREMWKAYDWRGSVQPFEPFWLVPGYQDYGKPFYSIPDDFYGLRETYLVQVGASSLPIYSTMRVVENLQATAAQGLPNCICYRPSVQAFRIHPGASFGASSPLYMITGTYKITPPRITRALSDQPILWDDMYFDTFCQYLAWASLSIGGRRREAAEQHDVAEMSLRRSAGAENLEQGEPTVHPGEGLVYPTGMGYGMSPWS